MPISAGTAARPEAIGPRPVPGSNNLSDGTSRATLGLRSTDMRNSARGSAFPAPDKEVVVFGGGNKEATPRSLSSIA